MLSSALADSDLFRSPSRKRTPARERRLSVVCRTSARKKTWTGRRERRSSKAGWKSGKSVVAVDEGALSALLEEEGGKQKETVFGAQDDVDVQYLQSSDSEDDDLQTDVAVERASAVALEEIEGSFPFELDKFQTAAIQELLSGKSVVVCAPTGPEYPCTGAMSGLCLGAGKTAIADAAAFACLASGRKTVYTTPLKALSNQKLYEFRQRFGLEKVGLITGDTNIRTDAPVLVMTTEILRNVFYDATGDPGLNDRLDEIGLVVLDEVHYLGDPGRGSVWEELIVGCPKHIQMLCMSATVANPHDLGDWISQIHGTCTTVKTSKRPVPLSWFFAFSKPDRNRAEIHPLLNKKQTNANPICLLEDSAGFANRRGEPRFAAFVPPLHDLILEMERKGFLPAIIFIFSRADCDAQTEKMQQFGVSLTTPEEQQIISAALEEVQESTPEAIKTSCVEALLGGIATHHAGCLPAWKVLVETLFQDGLLKVVFATGTLAAGINMPARTTVISTLARRTGSGNVEVLGHNELLQMAGRAGRRGFDTAGNCVILQSRFEGAADAVSILRKGSEPLTSHFTTGYSFVLNLLAKFSLEEAKVFLEKSFQNYLTGMGLVKRAEQIQELKAAIHQLTRQVDETALKARDDSDDGITSADLSQAIQKAQQDFHSIVKQAVAERTKEILNRMEGIAYPIPVLIDTTKNVLGKQFMNAVAVGQRMEETGKGESVLRIFCFGADNIFYNVSPKCLVGGIFSTVENVNLKDVTQKALTRKTKWKPTAAKHVLSCRGLKNHAKAAFAISQLKGFERVTWSPLTELHVAAKSAHVKELKKAWREVGSSDGEDTAAAKLQQKLRRAKRQLSRAVILKRDLEQQKDQGWKGFTSTMQILIAAGALEPGTLELTPLGQVTRELFGDNELWMAIIFTHPSVQPLPPSLLAAFASSFVAPSLCTKQGIIFNVPPPEELRQLMAELGEPQQELYQYELEYGAVTPQSLASLTLDASAAGLVEAWAAGCMWEQLTGSTNLDDGDLARLIGRTLDILRQIFLCTYLLEPLKNSAQAAYKSMNRSPIAYDIV